MSKYAEKLKDPRWQKKRLEVLNESEWTCSSCRSTDRTLHVHHRVYWPGIDPWDYPYPYYEVLCEDCHAEQTESDREGRRTAEAEGLEHEFHKRVFRLLPWFDHPESTVDLLVELSLLDRSFPTPGLFSLIPALTEGHMPDALRDAEAGRMADRYGDTKRPDPRPFEWHLLQALRRRLGEP